MITSGQPFSVAWRFLRNTLGTQQRREASNVRRSMEDRQDSKNGSISKKQEVVK